MPPVSINISKASHSIENEENIQLESDRLLLRNVDIEDLDSLINLASDYQIAEMMNGAIPNPYSADVAKEWISKHSHDSIQSASISWAISLKEKKEFLGSIQIRFSKDRCSGRLSYWIGNPYWGQGYASEAGRMILQYGFDKLKLKEIHAEHFHRNPASGSVLKKLGFKFIKSEEKLEKLNNRKEDFDLYVIAADDFFKNHRSK